jgi:hypothetical protein
VRTDQRRPQSPGAALVLGLVKSMPARPGRLEVYECPLNHFKSMHGPPTYALSYGIGVSNRHG